MGEGTEGHWWGRALKSTGGECGGHWWWGRTLNSTGGGRALKGIGREGTEGHWWWVGGGWGRALKVTGGSGEGGGRGKGGGRVTRE